MISSLNCTRHHPKKVFYSPGIKCQTMGLELRHINNKICFLDKIAELKGFAPQPVLKLTVKTSSVIIQLIKSLFSSFDITASAVGKL